MNIYLQTGLAVFLGVAPLWSAEDATIAPDAPLVSVRKAAGGELLQKGHLRIVRLYGTDAEQGRQHGELLSTPAKRVVDQVLYSAALPATVSTGKWFFDSLGDAWRRTSKFLEPAQIEGMDALARALNRHPGELRLTQTFPELFHCSGFAISGNATTDGSLYHGRILDYMTDMGLQESAVVFAISPKQGYRWINVGFAGFLGTVTAMNEKKLAIGEMGGAGQGQWDGKPMSFLLREIMERCATVDEAVAYLKNTPRTCEFFYVISSGENHQAVGIRATPQAVEVIPAGEAHPRLPNPSPETVLMSADTRYEKLSERVKNEYGQFDWKRSLDLMGRPVAMDSCLQAVLFGPDKRELWVSYAAKDGRPATTQPYVHLAWEELFPEGSNLESRSP